MTVVINDGGRAEAGFKGKTGDCVVRAIAIATGLDYKRVYKELTQMNKEMCFGNSVRNGVQRAVYQNYLECIGWEWVPKSGGGRSAVHLRSDELPSGTIIARCSKHVVAVIDGVMHDTYDASRNGTRLVYGYYRKALK